MPILAEDQIKFVAAAVKEWRALKKGREWESWRKVAAALSIGSQACMVEARSNQRKGSAYNAIFSKWCDETGFGDMPSNLRSRLLWLYEPQHLALVEMLRGQWSVAERMKWAHPDTLYKKVRAYLEVQSGETARKEQKRIDRARAAESATAHLAETAGSDFDPDAVAAHWLSSRPIGRIARLIVDVEPGRAAALIEALRERLEDAGQFEG